MKNSGKRCLATLLAVVLLLNVNVVSYASENSEQENEYSESNAVSWQRQKDNVINESYELKEKKGWNEEEGNKYYCDESGNRVVGLKKIDDKTYFFDEQGYMKTGWKTVEEHEYYFDIDSGVRYEDQICEIDGIEYEFDAEGNAKELKKDENKQNGNDNVEEEETEGIINETEKQSDLNGKVALPLKEQAVFKGWVEESDNTYYYDVNGNKVTGIHKIGRKLYYFEEKNSSGVLVKANWVMVNNKRYYAMPDGSLKIGWLSFGDEYYYCGEDGAIVCGKQKIDGNWYYFDEKGVRQTGWIEMGGEKYYGLPDGSLRVGWLSFGSTRYYCDDNAKVVTGMYSVNGIIYQFDSNGKLVLVKQGWHESNGEKYYGMPDGTYRVGWLSFGNTYYYCGEDGAIVYGKQKIDGKWYYFDKNGVRQTGWIEKEGEKYYGMPDGSLREGWLSFGNTYYYCGKDGAIVYGKQKIDGKWYYFDEKGIRQTGWIEKEGEKYYGMPDGSLRVGWLSFGSTRYYCNSDAVLVTDGPYTVDGMGYQFDKAGILVSAKGGWHEIGDKKYYGMPNGTYRVGWLSFGSTYYYCGKDGAIVYGKQKIDGNWYYFDESGVRQIGWIEKEGEKYYGMPDGSLRVGWLSFGSTHYYCNNDAVIVTDGPYTVDGIGYQFDKDGILVSVKGGWHEINDKKYYGMPDGTYRVGWLSFGSTYYYCGKDGAIVYGKQKIDGKWYYFDESGVRQAGWIETEGGKYYGMPDGSLREGWLSFGNTYYYCGKDGAIVYGKQKIDGKWYYFDENGIRQIGWIETEDGKYYGLPDGSLREGWLSFGDTYYYCEKDGIIVCGKHKIGGKWYYFDENGVRQTGWIETEDGKSYGMPDGSLREGWLSFGDTYYYCDNTGIVVIDDFAIDGILYTFNKNGVMKKKKGWGEYQGNKYYFNPETGFPYKGWVTFGNTYYYADNRGIMVKGWYYISGYYYYFYPDTCIMARNTTIDGYKIGADGRREKTGWYYENGYKFYYKNGVKQLDLDGILPRQSSYWIKVNRTTCSVTVYAKDGANGYIIPVKRFACSVGLPSTPTPTGTYYTPAKYRWHTLMGPSYGQYCTRIVGGVLFHSVAGYNMTSYNIKAKDYNKLGQPASHGCVRLTVRDAKWIYDNCPLNTKVTIYDSSDPGPLGKPATIKIPAGQNWDPTDPNI